MASKVGNLLKNVAAVKEVRILLCPTGASSQGVRSFIEQHYPQVRAKLPKETPILVREAMGIEPQLWARFEFGREQHISVTNQSADSILQALDTLLADKKPLSNK